MDTTYYTVQFRRVKVAGGEDRVYLVPEVNDKVESQGPAGRGRPAPRQGTGGIVRLEMARAKMERKSAGKALMEAAWI